MTSAAPSFVKPRAADEDQLQQVRAIVAMTRDLEAEKSDLEERLKKTNDALQEAYFTTLPDLFAAAGVTAIALPADGNSPAVEAKASPFYRANIAASWPEDKRAEAFQCLEDLGAADLIKTEVNVSFPKGDADVAEEFYESARVAGLNAQLGQAVSWQTLTAWLKDTVENRGIMPPLDKIGATVGRVVRLKVKDQ
jgi:hypothetical protein